MIVFNSKAQPLHFIVNDTILYNIYSEHSLAEVYDSLLEGAPINATDIEAYSFGRDYETTRWAPESVQAGPEAPERWHSSSTRARERDYYAENPTRETDLEDIRDWRQHLYEDPDWERIARLFEGIFDDEDNYTSGRFTEVDTPDREDLIRHIADALGIPPQLALDTSVPTAEKIKLGRDMQRVFFLFAENGHNAATWNYIPSIDAVKFFSALSPYEKRLIAGENYCPTTLLNNAYLYRQAHPNAVITRDVAFGTTESGLHAVDENYLSELKKKFEDKYRRAPRVLREYAQAQIAAGCADPDDIVAEFNLNSLSKVAQSQSPVLLALSSHIDFSQCKKDTPAFLAANIAVKDLHTLIADGFGEWFSAHKNEPWSVIEECLHQYAKRPFLWEQDVSAQDMLNKTKFALALEDKANYESAYDYRFADNRVAIAGRDIVVSQGNLKMYMLKADDLRNYTVGYDTNCCQRWNQAGGACVWKLTTDPFAAVVVIEREGQDILAQAFVWTDELKSTFVFDNIEFANDDVVASYAGLISDYVAALPYTNVHMGTGYVAGRYRTWGSPLAEHPRMQANMPTTLNSQRIYSDYKSSARIFKDRTGLKQGLRPGLCEVTHDDTWPATEWDIFAGSGKGAVLLNHNEIPLETKLRFAQTDVVFDENDTELRDLAFKYPVIFQFRDDIPEAWQRAFLEQEQNYKVLAYFTAPIREIRQIVIAADPDRVKDYPNAELEDWRQAILDKPSLVTDYPGYPDALPRELSVAAITNGGDDILPLIPTAHLDEDMIARAVHRNPRAILAFEGSALPLWIDAVSQQPYLISQLSAVPPELGQAAVAADPAAVLFWTDAPDEVIAECVSRMPSLVRNYPWSEAARHAAIVADPDIIAYMRGATEEEIELANRLRAADGGLSAGGA